MSGKSRRGSGGSRPGRRARAGVGTRRGRGEVVPERLARRADGLERLGRVRADPRAELGVGVEPVEGVVTGAEAREFDGDRDAGDALQRLHGVRGGRVRSRTSPRPRRDETDESLLQIRTARAWATRRDRRADEQRTTRVASAPRLGRALVSRRRAVQRSIHRDDRPSEPPRAPRRPRRAIPLRERVRRRQSFLQRRRASRGRPRHREHARARSRGHRRVRGRTGVAPGLVPSRRRVRRASPRRGVQGG